jgi:hypothetical protein
MHREGASMVSPADLPLAEPRWYARRITAPEVLRLSRGEPVPGVSEQDPRVQSIRGCRLTNIARMALSDALRCGYLYIQLTLYEPQIAHNLRTLWGWWCAAAGHPEIVLSTAQSSDAVRIRCDLSPTGRAWGFDAFRAMARLLGDQHAVDRAGWLFTPDELQIDGLEMEEAITVVRGLVDVATLGRFRPEMFAASSKSPVSGTPFPQHTRIERSDQ